MSDTFNDVKAIIKDLLGADEAKITPEARFREDLEADSLDLVSVSWRKRWMPRRFARF